MLGINPRSLWESEYASGRVDGQQRAVQANVNSDSWHTRQDRPNLRLPGQAMLTPIVMTKIEHIEKVNQPFFYQEFLRLDQ